MNDSERDGRARAGDGEWGGIEGRVRQVGQGRGKQEGNGDCEQQELFLSGGR